MAKKADSDTDATAGNVLLQPLLEKAVRESLRELARSATHPELGGSSKSIECIVRGVATKVLEEAGDSLGALRTAPEKRSPKPPKVPVERLLQDLSATPWMIWREANMHHRQEAVGHAPTAAPAGNVAPAEVAAADEESVPEDASRRSQQSSGSMQQQAVEGGEDFTADDIIEHAATGVNTKKLHPRQRFSTQAWPTGATSGSVDTGLSWLVSPMHHGGGVGFGEEAPSLARTELGIVGESPIVAREGLTIESNSTHHLLMQWKGRPRSVLMVAKPGDTLVLATLQDMAAWLTSQGIVVVLEPQLLADQPDLRTTLSRARTFTKADMLEKSIDLVITIGGDGTLTWAVSLFRGAMPPVLSFAAGSLGFLTPFPLDGWVRTLTRLLDLHRPRGPLPLTCRMRLRVAIRRRSSRGDSTVEPLTDGEEENLQVQCLNEVLVHRGQSGALAKLDVGVDGERVTLVQGDGLILATPTGSTAYSLAAGGSMVHPAVPAILLTPVSPHSLSFRPAVLPDSAVVTVGVPLNARCGAALSVDGKDICVLRIGDSVEVAMSPHPVPTICRNTETRDWFASVHEALQWNGRVEQK